LKQNSNKKSIYEELEKVLKEWCNNCRKEGLNVNKYKLVQKALEQVKIKELNNFKCSIGHIENFKKRNAIVSRQSTLFMQKFSEEVFIKLEEFIKNINKMKLEFLQNKLNMMEVDDDNSGNEDLTYINMAILLINI